MCIVYTPFIGTEKDKIIIENKIDDFIKKIIDIINNVIWRQVWEYLIYLRNIKIIKKLKY